MNELFKVIKEHDVITQTLADGRKRAAVVVDVEVKDPKLMASSVVEAVDKYCLSMSVVANSHCGNTAQPLILNDDPTTNRVHQLEHAIVGNLVLLVDDQYPGKIDHVQGLTVTSPEAVDSPMRQVAIIVTPNNPETQVEPGLIRQVVTAVTNHIVDFATDPAIQAVLKKY